MFSLYCNIYVHGKWTLELCENYDTLAEAVRQTIAMWPENDRPVNMFIANEDCNIVANFCPLGENGRDVIVVEGGETHVYTDLSYIYDADRIVATKLMLDGNPTRIDH